VTGWHRSPVQSPQINSRRSLYLKPVIQQIDHLLQRKPGLLPRDSWFANGEFVAPCLPQSCLRIARYQRRVGDSSHAGLSRKGTPACLRQL